MSCSNCFNGCADTVSDQCVKYTGIDVLPLDIHTGDSLLMVENKITAKILTLMDGSGIIPIIDPADVCEVVQELMPCCPPINLNQILTVFLKSICILNDKNEGLKDRIIILEAAINALNADYTLPLDCLTGVTASSDTHEIVQATINKVCTLATELHTLYTPTSELDAFIANYISTLPVTNLMSAKMVPWVPVPYFGPLTNYPATGDSFDITGAGAGAWLKVFLCNGQNGTPDLRGITLVGANTMGNNPYSNPATDPAIAGNPTYGQGTLKGANNVILTALQLAPHTHGTTVVVTDPGHTHTVTGSSFDNGGNGPLFITTDAEANGPKSVNTTPPSAATLTGVGVTVTVGSTGGGDPHPNIQPSYGTNYIIFIP